MLIFDPLIPQTTQILLAILSVAALLWSAYQLSRYNRILPIAFLSLLRLIIIVLVFIILNNPHYIEETRTPIPSRIAVVVDNSRSMTLRGDKVSRLDEANAWVEQLKAAQDDTINLEFYTVNDRLEVSREGESIEPQGVGTRIEPALQELLSHPSLSSLCAVALISDGQFPDSEALTAYANTFKKQQIPLYTLLTGDSQNARDLNIQNIRTQVVKGDDTLPTVTVDIALHQINEQNVPIQILKQGKVIAQSTFNAEGTQARISLKLPRMEQGMHSLVAKAPPLKGELSSLNNSKPFRIFVEEPDSLRVMYTEGTYQKWQSFRDAMQQDPNIRVDVFTNEQNRWAQEDMQYKIYIDEITKAEVPNISHPERGFPKTMEALLEYDVIIFSDVPYYALTLEQLENLKRFVEDFGGGFVMIGGGSSFGAGNYQKTIIEKIIPVVMEEERDSLTLRDGFPMVIPKTAYAHPIMDIGDSTISTRDAWGKLPRLFGTNTADRIKPGATLLGSFPNIQVASGALPALVVQEVGRGRSMAFLSDITFYWGQFLQTQWGEPMMNKNQSDMRYYKKFWNNTLRWLSAYKTQQEAHKPLKFINFPYTLEEGESVAGTLSLMDTNTEMITNATIELSLYQEDDLIETLKVIFDPEEDSYAFNLRAHPPGDYLIKANQVAGQASAKHTLTITPRDMELSMPMPEAKTLRQLATHSGGEFNLLHKQTRNPKEFLETLRKQSPHKAEKISYTIASLWDRTWILTLIITLLCIDWYLRLRWQPPML